MHRTPVRLVTASLLLASAAAFGAGVAAERTTVSSESQLAGPHADGRAIPATNAAASPARAGDGDAVASSAEATPGSDEHSRQGTATTGEAATAGAEPAVGDGADGGPQATESQPEELFGINPEATGLVGIAVALSLLLAALILTLGSPLVPVAITVVALAFTVLDVREVTHQLTESRPGLAALAATIALLHLLTAISALLVARVARGGADGLKVRSARDAG